MEHITVHEDLMVKVESFSLYNTPDYGPVLKVVYRRSDDARRQTSFFDCDKTSGDTLYALLRQLEPDAAC